MASSLQLMHFDPAAAFRNDLAAGIQARLVFYRAIAVNATDDDGLTMLAHAARVGDAEAVKSCSSAEQTPMQKIAMD